MIFFFRTPEFCEWGFMKARGKPIQEIWDKIPDETDILITHGPPLGTRHTLTDHHFELVLTITNLQIQWLTTNWSIIGHNHILLIDTYVGLFS